MGAAESKIGRTRGDGRRRRAAGGEDGGGQRRRIVADAQIVQRRECRAVQVAAVIAEHRVRQRRLVLVRPVGRERDVELVGGFPQQFAAYCLDARAAVVVRGLVSGLRIDGLRIDHERRLAVGRAGRIGNDLLPARLVLRGDADRGQQRVLDERQVGRETEVAPIVAAAGDVADEAFLVARRVGHDADRAADGVRTEQRALRAFQDFDPVHVEQLLVRADGARQVNAVDVDADAGVQVEGKIILANAADRGRENGTVAREGRAGVEVDARRQVADRTHIDEVAALQSLRGKCRDRDRHVLNILGAALRRHDHFLENAGVRLHRGCRRLLGLCGDRGEHR